MLLHSVFSIETAKKMWATEALYRNWCPLVERRGEEGNEPESKSLGFLRVSRLALLEAIQWLGSRGGRLYNKGICHLCL